MSSSARSFTLIEVLLSVALISMVATLTLPVGIDFYRSQQLDNAVNGLIQTLREAQFKAMAQADSNFGVYLGVGQIGQYSLFEGDSYQTKVDEEIFEISDLISFNGTTQVVFSKLTGRPDLIGGSSLVIQMEGLNDRQQTININGAGRINLEIEP